MQEEKQIKQEECHNDISNSNEYGYYDFNLLCSSAYTNTGCCMMDTSFDDTTETTIPLFGSSSIITTNVSNDDDDDDEDDDNNNNNKNNSKNNKFEQLEEEFQIMTSKLQMNIAKLSFMNKEKINTNNDYDGNKNLLPFLHDTDAKVEIEKQLAECKVILKQLWNECKEEEKGNTVLVRVVSSSSENEHEENEVIDHVHQFSLYKIQWQILRSEYEHHKKQTKFLLSISNNQPTTKKEKISRRHSTTK